jgi:protease-4
MVERSDSTTAALYVIVVVVAVLISTVLAPVVWEAAQPSTSDDDPSVAVVTLRGGTDPGNVNELTEDLRAARTNESVEAVVLRIDSPGGAVASSEEFYLAMNRTAQEMPVVAYVEGTAASGGYYGVSPADEIVVKPSSVVGSIGVIVQAPLSLVEQEQRTRSTFLRTGPDKAMITKDSIRNEMETLQNSFLNTIMHHRGDELSLDREEVATGDTYLGPVAVGNGFADSTGDLNSAIERAADSADGIDGEEYDVTYLEPVTPTRQPFSLAGDVEEVDGDVVYVDATADDSTQFEEPVQYYAVWGVPVEEEVSANASR